LGAVGGKEKEVEEEFRMFWENSYSEVMETFALAEFPLTQNYCEWC
jgi:hypothetical protein